MTRTGHPEQLSLLSLSDTPWLNCRRSGSLYSIIEYTSACIQPEIAESTRGGEGGGEVEEEDLAEKLLRSRNAPNKPQFQPVHLSSPQTPPPIPPNTTTTSNSGIRLDPRTLQRLKRSSPAVGVAVTCVPAAAPNILPCVFLPSSGFISSAASGYDESMSMP